jgi:hypothetical protein
MPLKLTAGLALKRGQPNYGSRSAHCQIEMEIDGRLPQDAAEIQTQVAAAYQFCREAVEQELSDRDESASSGVSPAEEANCEAAASQLATAKQVAYIEELADKHPYLVNGTLSGHIHARFERRLNQLTRRQASQLINEFKQNQLIVR